MHSNGTGLRPLDDKRWEKAIDIGRALAVLKAFPLQNARLAAVADAGRRLQQQGYKLSVHEDTYRFDERELERITERIRATFTELGPANCLDNLFRGLKSTFPFDFDMYLLGRRYAHGTGVREPSFPFGFLVNLAVRVPFPHCAPTEPERKWKEALELSRDLISALNLEPFSAFPHMNTHPTRIEAALREVALYDHLFSLRQWRLTFTPFLLNEFFATDYDALFANKLNWTPADAADLCRAVTHFATRDPNVITIGALRQAGVKRDTLDRMLPYFVHPEGSVNAGYVSPFCATKADLMFKPLIQVGPQHVLLPAASLMGPAFYEATMLALRHISNAATNDLPGKGTERVVRALFLKANIPVSFVAAEYDLGDYGGGECDLVIESDEQILFVECKAKALTRGSMAAVQGDALLDFADGMFAAQTQALRHERILRSLGNIEFKDGSRLEWRDRRITRLSVTLLDHGALQDRMVLVNSLNALRGAVVNSDPGYGKAKQVKDFNKDLDDLRSETEKLVNAGQSVQAQAFNAASLSVGNLRYCSTASAISNNFASG